MYVSLLKTTNGIFLYANSKGSVEAWKTLKKARAYYEDAYDKMHARSYQWSMSACINMIQFQPSIIKIKDIEDLKRVASKPPRLVSMEPYRVIIMA